MVEVQSSDHETVELPTFQTSGASEYEVIECMDEAKIYGNVKQRIREECKAAPIIFIDKHYDPLKGTTHAL